MNQQDYPNDAQWEERIITKVRVENSGWSIDRDDGWSFLVQKPSPVVPKTGMLARFYGPGMGNSVRGLFLNGTKIYYRTVEEEKEYQANLLYGATIEEWLERWDNGDNVWSIEMGGLGPSYEQAIQIAVAEIVRELINGKYSADKWEDSMAWTEDSALIESNVIEVPPVKNLHLSGAQWGAALKLATSLYQHGPVNLLTDDKIKDRAIQVSKDFPSYADLMKPGKGKE